MSKDAVGKDAVGEDAVDEGEDAVGEDAVGEDVLGEDVEPSRMFSGYSTTACHHLLQDCCVPLP